MSENFDGESGHATGEGSAPQAWVWSQYKGVLSGVESRGSAVVKQSFPPSGSRSQIKVEVLQTVSDRPSAPETEELIRTDRARHPLAVAVGFAAAIMILVVLARLFSPGSAP
jgi:hypothetical protein